MNVYLVGGAVRDELIGRKIKEKDWVVVDSNPDELLNLGYKQVGKKFPVFLHPETSEEYALARLEKKISNFISTGIEWVPLNAVKISDERKEELINFFETLEENDDVQNIYSNIKFSN